MEKRWSHGRWATAGGVVALAGLAFAGWWFGIRPTHLPSGTVVRLELAGSRATAMSLVGGQVDAFTEALRGDLAFIAGYGAALIGACWVAMHIHLSAAARRLAQVALAGAIAVAGCDVLENFFLWRGLASVESGGDGWFQTAAALAVVKFSLLLFVLPVALITTFTVLKRAISGGGESGYGDLKHKITLPWPVENAAGDVWPAANGEGGDADSSESHRHQVDSAVVPPGRDPAEVGFCLSGGGIRSGCVSLGALQSLRKCVTRARYLVSVSGGGYISGAMQLALYPGAGPGPDAPTSTAVPGDVYERGSVEEDHTRRHGDYIADGARDWLAAMGVLLRGLLGSIVVISATIISAGLALSYFYKQIPLVELGPHGDVARGLSSYFRSVSCSDFVNQGGKCPTPSFPVPHGYAGWTVLWTAVAAAVVWLVYVWLIDARGGERFQRFVKRASRALWLIALLLSVIVFVLPAILWGAAQLTYLVAGDKQAGTGPTGAGGGIGLTIFLAYAGSIASILWRHKKEIQTTVAAASKKDCEKKEGEGEKLQTAVPNGLTQYIIVWAALLALGVANLLLLSATILTGDQWHIGVQLGIPAGLLVFYLIVDQTWMSLHPFYRRRLASAFSVRRVLRNHRSVARPYDFDKEATPLATYGMRQPEDASATERWPQVIFACAANLSGPDRTAPASRAVSYTLSHDYVGGPDVGYAPTQAVENVLSGPLAADMTVQAAVAISGAAFASAMGRQARAFQTLLALSNARLGTWLPNPAYLYGLSEDPPWWLPRLPRIRRLTYLFREIFGQFPYDNRLLLVTDGGHYDNLGLIEALRHKCRNVICIDGSGDSPPFPETLYQSITMAWEQLGVKITLHDELDLVPGSAEPLAPEDPLKSLSARLSEKAVVVGNITYPEAFRVGNGSLSPDGRLIFAKALLTPEMPAELLAYAQSTPVFPRDSTADQWFSGDQFDAYQRLGQYIGEVAATKDLLIV